MSQHNFSSSSLINAVLNEKVVLAATHSRVYYFGKCPKILNTFLFLFSNKMLVFRAGIHRMLVRKDPDQSDLGLHCLSGHFSKSFW